MAPSKEHRPSDEQLSTSRQLASKKTRFVFQGRNKSILYRYTILMHVRIWMKGTTNSFSYLFLADSGIRSQRSQACILKQTDGFIRWNDSNSFNSYHEIPSQQSARPLPTHALESSGFSIEAAHSVFMANLASLQTTVQAAFSSLAFSARTLKARKAPAHQPLGAKVQQVWSLTQIFSLDFLQSRIIAKIRVI